ncbi:MAG: isoleucine--tRNA ligase [Alphaproteobacteria bacterium]|nr:isoleucine--tRNA ligase [Alphaproteobacteria bacterium]
MKNYPQFDSTLSFPTMEMRVLEYWDKNKIFEKSVDMRPAHNEFVFYDGPPFANGLPHYGHIMASYVKDVVFRYQTMAGKRVECRLGWDCHGLPAEMAAEQKLGVFGRKAIEEFGVAKFNEACRQDVLKYSGVFRDLFHRMGRWVDFNNDYHTMDLSFMESVINNFKQLYDKGLVYEDFRVLPYSWGAQVPLSNFEVNQGYKDTTDTAVTVLFKLDDGRHIMAWTTTPWTLPTNQMIAVGADIDYSVMQEGDGKQYILASALKGKYKQQLEKAEEVAVIKGAELVGLPYEPMFPYFKDLKAKGAFKILAADFVSTQDGTGVVHIAPGSGQEDFELCRAHDKDFPIVCAIDDAGCMTADVPDYAGQRVVDTNEQITARLKAEGKLVKKEQVTHSYPFCYRTDTPLVYRAMTSWFVRVESLRDRLVELNQQINWVPDHIKDGRFGKWLEGARDWSISRNRFWGTPIPVWKSDNPKFPRVDVLGSLAEIKEKTGKDIDDLHRPHIDEVVYPNPDDPSGKTMMRRVTDVFDCWFESGSMPEGQVHYPFENSEWFKEHFPADFIVEGMDQTRGWFYTLHVLGVALHDKPAFLNCVSTGLIMAEDGRKLSKRLKNYPEYDTVLDTMGSDALRFWLMASPIVRGKNIAVDMKGQEISKAMRRAQIPLVNAYNFFCMYANAEGIKAQFNPKAKKDILDKYILSKTKQLVQGARKAMDAYDIPGACAQMEDFLEVLNNWYIRRSRQRFWDGKDKAAFDTLYTVLATLLKVAAPVLPMTAEHLYRGLTGEESVHLADWPDVSKWSDDGMADEMDFTRQVCATMKAVRELHRLRNRLPLKTGIVAGSAAKLGTQMVDIIKDEVNIKELVATCQIERWAAPYLYIKTPLVGKRLPKSMKAILDASKGTGWKVNPDGTLSIAGETLLADEYEYRLEVKSGDSKGLAGQALPDNTAVVLLDTQISPELEREGLARDFVRLVQSRRKDDGFDISDRIAVDYHTGDIKVKLSVDEYEDYIKSQILAVEINFATNDGKGETFGDGEIFVALRKAKK